VRVRCLQPADDRLREDVAQKTVTALALPVKLAFTQEQHPGETLKRIRPRRTDHGEDHEIDVRRHDVDPRVMTKEHACGGVVADDKGRGGCRVHVLQAQQRIGQREH
jgi:hypothetical protein